jgi:hypothetical protein
MRRINQRAIDAWIYKYYSDLYWSARALLRKFRNWYKSV